MFEPNSRYATLPIGTTSIPGPSGEPRPVRYIRRRFLPPPESTATIVEHAVVQGERLDNITARYLGDPTQFWRVCDANNVLRPQELTDEPGRRIRIALPQL
jgi:hypothetical protein